MSSRLTTSYDFNNFNPNKCEIALLKSKGSTEIKLVKKDIFSFFGKHIFSFTYSYNLAKINTALEQMKKNVSQTQDGLQKYVHYCQVYNKSVENYKKSLWVQLMGSDPKIKPIEDIALKILNIQRTQPNDANQQSDDTENLPNSADELPDDSSLSSPSNDADKLPDDSSLSSPSNDADKLPDDSSLSSPSNDADKLPDDSSLSSPSNDADKLPDDSSLSSPSNEEPASSNHFTPTAADQDPSEPPSNPTSPQMNGSIYPNDSSDPQQLSPKENDAIPLYQLSDEPGIPDVLPPVGKSVKIGLPNIDIHGTFGNTCWANSFLQFVADGPEYDGLFVDELPQHIDGYDATFIDENAPDKAIILDEMEQTLNTEKKRIAAERQAIYSQKNNLRRQKQVIDQKKADFNTMVKEKKESGSDLALYDQDIKEEEAIRQKEAAIKLQEEIYLDQTKKFRAEKYKQNREAAIRAQKSFRAIITMLRTGKTLDGKDIDPPYINHEHYKSFLRSLLQLYNPSGGKFVLSEPIPGQQTEPNAIGQQQESKEFLESLCMAFQWKPARYKAESSANFPGSDNFPSLIQIFEPANGTPAHVSTPPKERNNELVLEINLTSISRKIQKRQEEAAKKREEYDSLSDSLQEYMDSDSIDPVQVAKQEAKIEKAEMELDELKTLIAAEKLKPLDLAELASDSDVVTTRIPEGRFEWNSTSFFTHLPKTMILSLRRIVTNEYGGEEKLVNPLQVNEDNTISLTEYRIVSDRNGKKRVEPAKTYRYQIKTAIIHAGGASGGHYTCVKRDAEGNNILHNDDQTFDRGPADKSFGTEGILFRLERIDEASKDHEQPEGNSWWTRIWQLWS